MNRHRAKCIDQSTTPKQWKRGGRREGMIPKGGEVEKQATLRDNCVHKNQ